jgi:hypothetical protein
MILGLLEDQGEHPNLLTASVMVTDHEVTLF